MRGKTTTSFHLWQTCGGAVGVPVRSDDHAFQAQVQPDHLRRQGQRFDILFEQEGDEGATCAIFRDGYRRGLASIRQGTRPDNGGWLIDLCQGERGTVPLAGTSGRGCRWLKVLSLEIDNLLQQGGGQALLPLLFLLLLYKGVVSI